MEAIREDAQLIGMNLLPEKSKEKYVQVYQNFLQWKEEKNVDSENFSEDVLLVYFNELKSKYFLVMFITWLYVKYKKFEVNTKQVHYGAITRC